MADSLRLQILKVLTTQLETVTPINGYEYNLEGKVYRGRAGYGHETSPPWVGLFELRPEELYLRAGETFQKDDWFIGVQGVVAADDEHPTDPAHNLMADVKKAIAVFLNRSPMARNPAYMMGGLIADLRMDGGMTFTPQENPAVAAFALRLTLTIAEDLEKPHG